MKNLLDKPTVVGNIVFGKDGVSIMRQYQDPLETAEIFDQLYPAEKAKKDCAEALECALAYVKARIKHCASELERNFASAALVDTHRVMWKGGHFSRPTYELMVALVERNPQSWDDLSVWELQQVIRALHHQRNSNTDKCYSFTICVMAFDIATEILCAKSAQSCGQ